MPSLKAPPKKIKTETQARPVQAAPVTTGRILDPAAPAYSYTAIDRDEPQPDTCIEVSVEHDEKGMVRGEGPSIELAILPLAPNGDLYEDRPFSGPGVQMTVGAAQCLQKALAEAVDTIMRDETNPSATAEPEPSLSASYPEAEASPPSAEPERRASRVFDYGKESVAKREFGLIKQPAWKIDLRHGDEEIFRTYEAALQFLRNCFGEFELVDGSVLSGGARVANLNRTHVLALRGV